MEGCFNKDTIMDDQYVKVDFANLDFVILLFIFIGGFDLSFGFFWMSEYQTKKLNLNCDSNSSNSSSFNLNIHSNRISLRR